MPTKSVYQEKPPYIEIGQKFNRLTVVGHGPRVPNGTGGRSSVATWECVCDCGSPINVRKGQLISGATKSCGCANLDALRARGTHRDTQSTEYCTWEQMLNRCLNPRTPAYSRYGGRGITVSDEWRSSYETFLADVGRKPTPQHSIERIDNDGNYELGNVKWATKTEQANNRRNNRFVEFRGERKTIAQWAVSVQMPVPRIYERLVCLGWTVERALTTPMNPNYQRKRREV